MRILDATAGSRSIWYQKNHPFVTFMDQRNEVINTKHKDVKFKNSRIIRVNPDIQAKWECLPFKDESFDVVVFDPPHIFGNRGTIWSGLELRYGKFYNDNWKEIMRKGIKELFRSLKTNGIFIFKWAESHKKITEVLKLFPYQPLMGTRTGQANKNHWILFVKHRLEKQLF